jgi:hypothetical protein
MQTSQLRLIQKDVLEPLLRDPGRLIVILDACRYDVFEQVNWLPGKLSKAISAGSTTTEWAINTFTDFYPGVAYVSSVPYIAAKVIIEAQKSFLGLEHFSSVIDVWDWGYDLETETVLPEVVVHTALQAKKDYPDKVIIAHFIQPHCPYVGQPLLTLKIWESISKNKYEGFPSLEVIFKTHGSLLMEAYRGNLVRALSSVEQLASFFDHVIITADHGEGFGEKGIYGHKAGIKIPELLEVPWLDLT